MHVNHQAKGQGGSLLVRNLDIGVTVIFSFVDVIAQGVLVRRKPPKSPPVFSTHSSHSDMPLLGGVEPTTVCRSCSFHFSINIPG